MRHTRPAPLDAADRRVRLAGWLLGAALLSPLPAAADGSLVIVGGALADDNREVYGAFLGALQGDGAVVVIPAASGRPARAAAEFARTLEAHGLEAGRVRVFPLAVRDDAGTAEVDESTWADNAWDASRVAELGEPSGFWFTGGDQMRIVQTMRGPEGRESPLLQLVRRRLAEGAVVGGTSAGAAVMSRRMIAGGDSFRALLDPLAASYSSTEDQDSGRLFLDRGLGFIGSGIVDQHFDRKARLGRLVRALAETGETVGYGVDEDTALVVDLSTGTASVAGRGSVTVLDARSARFDFKGEELASQLALSSGGSGTRFQMDPPAMVKAPGKPTRGHEYFGHEVLAGGGMAFSNARLDQALGYDLLDNDASSELSRYSLDDAGRMLVYRFSETPQSQGFWLSLGSVDRYAVSDVRLDIRRTVIRPPGPAAVQ
jgi:cyanophycinase